MPTSRKTTTRSTRTRSSSSKAKTVEPLPVVEPTEEHPAPLDDAVGYDIGDKRVNLAQLDHEIKVATGYDGDVNLALSGTVLWMTPAGLDAGKIAQAVADHQPDPNWGIPNVIQYFNDALGRLRENPDGELTDADRDALIKGIALNFTALMPSSGLNA